MTTKRKSSQRTATHAEKTGSKYGLCGSKGGKVACGSDVVDCVECLKILAHMEAKAKDAVQESKPAKKAKAPTAEEADAVLAGMAAKIDASLAAAPETTVEPTAEPAKAKRVKPAQAPTEPATRDPRLPPVGTIIDKRDRHGELRASCKVVAGGVDYKGTVHKSLSGAARAAAQDLGINGNQNGYIFWGIVKPAHATDHLERLSKTFARIDSTWAAAIAASRADAETMAKLLAELKNQIDGLRAIEKTWPE